MEEWLTALMKSSLADNLHNGRANQSDANFGLTAAIAEALLQSRPGEISLLPALPPAWANGSIHGLRARGGFEVSLEWNDGSLSSAQIFSRAGGSLTVRCANNTIELKMLPGKRLRLNRNLTLMN
ncbi:MAG TPA: hypothetical protein VLT16_17865 [Candidatus Limnocylindrales bacterium]|nr:hypothetical protein [Candidatus Limnocylindrales bacterium]